MHIKGIFYGNACGITIQKLYVCVCVFYLNHPICQEPAQNANKPIPYHAANGWVHNKFPPPTKKSEWYTLNAISNHAYTVYFSDFELACCSPHEYGTDATKWRQMGREAAAEQGRRPMQRASGRAIEFARLNLSRWIWGSDESKYRLIYVEL